MAVFIFGLIYCMKKILLSVAVLTLSLFLFASGNTQGDGTTPPGYKFSAPADAPVYETETPDFHTVNDEDSIRDLFKQPFRFGIPFATQIDFNSHGLWTVLPDGSRMWQLKISCPDAISINLGFSQFNLAEGSRLYVYSADRQLSLGAFTKEHHNPDGLFGTEIIPGSAVVVEFVEDPNAAPSTFTIFRITYGYRDAKAYAFKSFGNAGSCEVNVNCPVGAGWQTQKRSVVCLVSGGSEFCTGAVVNNTANNGIPYVLSANHCGPADGTWVFRFNWESATCTNPATNPASQSLNGATQRAANAGSDFLLCQINSAIPANYNVYYAGWNRNNVALDSSVCIHHPSGDIKKISFANTPYISATYSGAQCWQTGLWSGSGVTEPGSSGSPLFDPNKRIVGQLYGGPSSCTSSTANRYDYYGKFSTSWATGTTNATRLREWLDPSNTGVTVLDGYDPNAPTVALDAQSLSIVSPTGNYCSGNGIVPVVSIRNAGVTTLTNLSILYKVDNNSFQTFSWTGSLASGANANVTLPAFSTTNGNHTFTIKLSAPNGGTDGNLSNDSLTGSFTVTPPTGNTTYPFTEGFQATTFPPTGWTINNLNGDYTWGRTTAAGGFGASSASARITHNSSTNSAGNVDELVLPYMNFSALSTARIRFAVAHARWNATYIDSLKVLVSGDCGVTWQTLYAKGGSSLATAPDIASNFTPTASQWRNDSVVLNSYIGNPYVRIKLVSVSGWGNRIYLDDININGAAALPLSVTTSSIQSPTCTGSANGSIDITPSGGIPALSYNWSNGASTQDVSGLTAGTYSVTVTDANGATAAINSIVLSAASPLNAATNGTNISCFGGTNGTANVTANGGTGNLNYLWSNGATTATVSGLATGSYTVTISDQNNCSVTAAVSLTQPVAIQLSETLTNSSCAQPAGGSVVISATGGNAPYTYNWSTGNTSSSLTNLSSGSYTLTLTDAQNCSSTATYTVLQNPSFSNNAQIIPVNCSGEANGAIIPALQNGVAPYSFNWSNGSSDATLSGVQAGAYSVTITDNSGCSAQFNYTLTEPAAISVTLVAQSVSCAGQNNGQIQLNVQGGNPGYQYAWSNGQNTNPLQNVSGGFYAVTVTDGNGCSASTAATLNEPTPLSIQENITAVTCAGESTGSIGITGSGGSSPYTFSWNTGSSSSTLSNLTAGFYSITLTDAAGCTTSSGYTVTEPSPVTSNTSVTDATNGSGGVIQFTPVGGTPPYIVTGNGTSISSPWLDLSPGNYTLQVTDSKGCAQTVNVTVGNITSIIENLLESITVYPQPVHENLSIVFQDWHAGVNMRIYTAAGALVWEQSIEQETTQVSFTDWSKGMYLLQLQDQVNSRWMRIIRQ